jgi:DNA-binding NarL/FixJ family response regulator
MNKIRVVLIEDDNLTRVALKTSLNQSEQIEWIGEAINGREGLELLQNTQPDIGIIDIGLPDLDGIELTKQFRKFQAAQTKPTTKILILTLHDSEEEILAAFAAGADSYCMKDTSRELFLEALKATQEGNAWIDPAIARVILSQAKKTKQTSQNNNAKSNNTQKTSILTDRELEVLQLIVDGYSNAEIAERLYITLGTVKTHVRKILNKLCADDRTQAAVRALRMGLVG